MVESPGLKIFDKPGGMTGVPGGRPGGLAGVTGNEPDLGMMVLRHRLRRRREDGGKGGSDYTIENRLGFLPDKLTSS